MSEKIRFQMRISPETDSKIKKAMEVDNCQSQNEFVEKALRFYCGYVSASNSLEVLPPLLASAIRGSIQDTENRIARLLFKMVNSVFSRTAKLWPETPSGDMTLR